MALQISSIPRKFTFDDDGTEVDLPDPSPSMTPEQVVKFYSAQYPQIVSSSVEGPVIKKDKAHYNISHSAQSKG